MNVLFEEEGSFKIGTLMADNETSVQVESPSGKRSKVKAANVLLRFNGPAAADLLAAAEPLAAEIEADFLWECMGDDEFSFLDCARDYFGHPPAPVEALAILLVLHDAPVFFHRKGKGRYRKAPADILRAALAGQEKKRRMAEAIAQMSASLSAGVLPAELAPMVRELLYKPDRNKPETKALEAACAATGLSPAHLLYRCGALKSPYEVHYGRFLHEFFPRGTAFPASMAPADLPDLAQSDVAAFSLDDASTTEIDDAFSVQPLPGIGWRIGIHIAAPALGILPGSDLDGVALARLSTVYMPGNKITMLPKNVIEAFTLSAGRVVPAVSLYLNVSTELALLSTESRVERIRIAANLHLQQVEPLFNETTLAAGISHFPCSEELLLLWRFACANEARRGKTPSTNFADYSFDVEGSLEDVESCRVRISERKRGSPLDKLVAELAIIANSTWGTWLAEKNVPAIYRVKSAGKVRMTTSAQPHEGLGVPYYIWATSPLRRYADLVNQRQLIALLEGKNPPFAARSDVLFAIIRDFDLTYSAYAEFQRALERYWCLRWLRQENIDSIEAIVRRETLVKLNGLPLLVQVPSLPALPPGSRVRLQIENRDELTLAFSCRYLETLDGNDPGTVILSDSENVEETEEENPL